MEIVSFMSNLTRSTSNSSIVMIRRHVLILLISALKQKQWNEGRRSGEAACVRPTLISTVISCYQSLKLHVPNKYRDLWPVLLYGADEFFFATASYRQICSYD